ncbi:protein rogdi isoform X1 [Ixodes scapularis]|nr:protein rogdi isoform X1 [Ixodes scapularis]
MAEADVDEIEALHAEFEWLLQEEVNIVLEQLQGVIMECSKRFPVSIPDVDAPVKSEKFFMTSTSSTSSSDQIKVVVTLTGDNISHADITLRIPKHAMPNLRTIVQNDCQWKLQQVQDAGNNLLQALSLLTPPPLKTRFEFKSAEEVTQLMTTIMGCLQRGRASLIIPKKRTIEEILGSRNMNSSAALHTGTAIPARSSRTPLMLQQKSLQPPLPSDIAASFYVQSHKLVFAVYHIHKDSHGQPKFDVFHAEASVPWLSEVLVLFTIALQLCQQLKDKVGVFYQFRDFQIP